jgi:hypothetical protein
MAKQVLLQQLGEMVDGKIHFVAGRDEDVFHIEDGDKFFTAVFTVDPFEGQATDS